MRTDPFGTVELRRRVLEGWTALPERFREDANAEEDLVRGGYRDRLLVELAQNAGDAARRAGGQGHLRLELTGDVLRAANTGAPLDEAGVRGLSTLRASGKRDEPDSVGRFGVGFAAVLAVSHEPELRSVDGGVRFSASATRGQVAGIPSLAGELARREGAVPVLRLPWPVGEPPSDGFATEVVLPLRAGARDAVVAAMDALSADLLLALPGLARIDVVVDGIGRTVERSGDGGTVRLTDGDAVTTWALAQRSGELTAEVAALRAVEVRGHRAWTVTCAVPLDGDGRPRPLPEGQVVHAPTPSDEPLSLPVRLIAPFPLGPDRRHVLPGPVTDVLVEAAAATLADLVLALPADPALFGLVPRISLAGAPLDAALGTAALARLREVAWLPVAGGADGERQPPERVVVLDDATAERVSALSGVLPGLLPAEWSRPAGRGARTALGIRRVGLAEAVEAVRGVHRPPAWWSALYEALDGADREELAALPVPLADGRLAHGPAGVLLPDAGLPVDRLAPLRLRLADPAAAGTPGARRLLERLGARPATAAAVLADPAVRTAVEGSMDAVDDVLDGPPPDELADAVLALVAAAAPGVGEYPWLAELALPDADGGWAPAGELVLPGSPLAAVLAEGSLGTLDATTAASTDPDVLRAVGVLDAFALVRAEDPDDLDVDGADEWADAVIDFLPPGEPVPDWPPLIGVRDLELVVDWPRALSLLATAPAEAWADVVVGGVRGPAYLRWWLRTHPVLDGRRPDRLRGPASTELQGLYEAATGDARVLELLRPPATVDEVVGDVDAAIDLLERLGDAQRTVSPGVLRTVYARLAVALDGIDVRPPALVRVAPDRVAADVVVLDAPWLQPLVEPPVVPAGGAPYAVADLLDAPLASELVPGGGPGGGGSRRSWASVPGAGLAAARLGVPELAGDVVVQEAPAVGGRAIAWWPGASADPEGADVVDGSPAALGRALAWRYGAWPLRQALAEAFAAPERSADLAAEDAVGE
jgi:hypothetical protein